MFVPQNQQPMQEFKKSVEMVSEQQPAPMNVNSQDFAVSKEIKTIPVVIAMNKLGNGAIQAASGTGGLGNKQAAAALGERKVVYKDILIHNLHVSIQEFQKKQKMY
jgi:hypothetical protein